MRNLHDVAHWANSFEPFGRPDGTTNARWVQAVTKAKLVYQGFGPWRLLARSIAPEIRLHKSSEYVSESVPGPRRGSPRVVTDGRVHSQIAITMDNYGDGILATQHTDHP